jgi:hypothetical protein
MGETRLPEPQDAGFDTAQPVRQGIRTPKFSLSGPEGQGRIMETADDGRQRRVRWEMSVEKERCACFEPGWQEAS